MTKIADIVVYKWCYWYFAAWASEVVKCYLINEGVQKVSLDFVRAKLSGHLV